MEMKESEGLNQDITFICDRKETSLAVFNSGNL